MRFARLFVVALVCVYAGRAFGWIHPLNVPSRGTNPFWSCNLRCYHTGTDYVPLCLYDREPCAGNELPEVRAVCSGFVREVKFKNDEGNYGGRVLIECDAAPMTCLHGHLGYSENGVVDERVPVADHTNDIYVVVGDWVEQGFPIGRLGTSQENGGSTPHVHVACHHGEYLGAVNECGRWTYAGYTAQAYGEQNECYCNVMDNWVDFEAILRGEPMPLRIDGGGVDPVSGHPNETTFAWTLAAEGGGGLPIKATLFIYNPVHMREFPFEMHYVDGTRDPYRFTYTGRLQNEAQYSYRFRVETCRDAIEDQDITRLGPLVSSEAAVVRNDEQCHNRADDDGDTLSDCFDSDCYADPGCTPRIDDVSCSTYGRGEDAVCDVLGQFVEGQGQEVQNLWIGCAENISARIANNEVNHIGVTLRWSCGCVRGSQNAAYRIPWSPPTEGCDDPWGACLQNAVTLTDGCDGRGCGQNACGEACALCEDGCECVGGQCECDLVCPANASCRPAAEEEICNGDDDDGDGDIDNGFDVGAACAVGIGECRRSGNKVCAANQRETTCNVQEGERRPETCNNLDDNCDGNTDQFTEECRNECNRGERRCNAGQWSACNAQVCPPPPPDCIPEPEICNNQSDDCDDDVDEDIVISCRTACEEGVQVCEFGEFSACTARQPQPEICDNADNDCDGNLNNGVLNACGQCGPVPAEVCDGHDNDCDREVDEGCACAPVGAQRVCGSNIGECRQGAQTCGPNGWGVCAGEVLPQPEICDNRDNDCDSNRDDNVTRNCSNECGNAGTQTCNAGQWDVCNAAACPPQCVPQAEVCNGRDDDCDRVADDGFDVGAACAVGIGECRRNGNKVCKADGSGTECNAQVGQPGIETCNNRDDDCDGNIDDSVSRNCQNGCEGSELCENGVWGPCSTQVQPEVCNNRDDDCDRVVDDGLTRQCQTICGVGVEQCIGGGWGNCSVRQPTNETCNNEDDDCNGARDDNLFRACQNGCGGIEECQNGNWSACSVQPQPEVCDNQDNNCNDRSDEDLTRNCSNECGNQGTQTCNAGQWGACNAAACPPACNAATFWSPSSMSTSAQNPNNGVTLTSEIRERADGGLEIRVCSGGNFVNPIHVDFEEYFNSGFGTTVFDGVLNGVGNRCTPWGQLSQEEFWEDGEGLGGDISIVSPANCADRWERTIDCDAQADPGCGSCWYMNTGVMTRTCRE